MVAHTLAQHGAVAKFVEVQDSLPPRWLDLTVTKDFVPSPGDPY